jgi:opacity protein-like surface antigen
MGNARRMVVFIISTFISVQKVLGAEQSTEDTLNNSNQWNMEFTPYFWAAEIDGDATLRGRTGPVEGSFSDLLDNLDIAFMGRLEAWQDRWGIFLDGLYMDLGADFSTPTALLSTDIDVKMAVLDFGMGHRLLETPIGENNNQSLSFDLLGGGRYINLDGEIDIKVGGPLAGLGLGRKFGRREEWVEPVIGGRLRWDLNEKLAAAVRFDFGGFDIGDGSNLTWNLVAGIDYKLKENMSLKAGYRIFDLDYDSGSGSNEFGIDAQFRGPIFGLTILF